MQHLKFHFEHMNKTISFLIAPILLASCLTSPEFNRDNPRDLNTGIPYVRDLSYVINQNGILVNWFDGSIRNTEIVVTQKIYDLVGEPDSLIKSVSFPEDRTFFQDLSNNFGYPYELIVSSFIHDNDQKIVAQYSDTLFIEYGVLELKSQTKSATSYRVGLINFPGSKVQNLLFEANANGSWEVINEASKDTRVFSYPIESYSGEVQFRISYGILNFNSEVSRAQPILITVDF